MLDKDRVLYGLVIVFIHDYIRYNHTTDARIAAGICCMMGELG